MNNERMYDVLRVPVVSEKASLVNEAANQVVFEVRRDATKSEIAQSIAKLFDVRVTKVNTASVPGKTKLFRGMPGTRPGWRKAYVTLAAGEQIDFLGGAQ